MRKKLREVDMRQALTLVALATLAVKAGKKAVSKELGKKFGIRSREDRQCFNHLWKIYNRAGVGKNKPKRLRDVRDAYDTLGELVRGRISQHRGFRHVRHVSSNTPFVVFSDHHLMPRGHRHDYFNSLGNANLYRQVLESYYLRNGYTLIENGDVEDLVIFEPKLDDCKRRARMTWDELFEHRINERLRQLEQIFTNNRATYNVVRQFNEQNRYIRLAGNHDMDMQHPEFERLMEERAGFRGFEAVDFLLLRTVSRGRFVGMPRVVVCHGHQFDANTIPRHAPLIGETISECLGWAFQGADRIWKWSDGPEQWVGGAPFRNLLSTSKVRGRGLVLEAILGHEIAWEYFESNNTTRAILKELWSGNEFIKFRHTDEEMAAEQMKRVFPARRSRPTLVLGHTHEPRSNALSKGEFTINYYANSGTPGRFQNLLWCLEIINGVPRVVSWSLPAIEQALPRRGPLPFMPRVFRFEGRPVRRVYRGSNGRLSGQIERW
jgi:predicted phosphodiesterase